MVLLSCAAFPFLLRSVRACRGCGQSSPSISDFIYPYVFVAGPNKNDNLPVSSFTEAMVMKTSQLGGPSGLTSGRVPQLEHQIRE